MKKTFPLTQPKLHPDRVLDAVKHEIRKYLKRERRKPLPEGVEFLDLIVYHDLTEEHARICARQLRRWEFRRSLSAAIWCRAALRW